VAERKRAAARKEPEQPASATPQSPHPAEDVPAEPQTRGASNQSAQLPHNAAAGCARAAAYFDRIAAVSDNPAEVRKLARAAIDDVSRFVPDAMRQAARDEVAR
jgi:hypothetical protein